MILKRASRALSAVGRMSWLEYFAVLFESACKRRPLALPPIIRNYK
jgi:hypothetical protein